MSDSLDVAIFQLNNGPEIVANQDNITSLLASIDVSAADLWVFPECALFRNRDQDDFKAGLIKQAGPVLSREAGV